MTINDIAKLSGVSKSTVSRYLNGGSVSDKSSKKIKEIIEKTNFHPNQIASRLKSKKSKIVGLLISELTSRSVAKIVDSLQFCLRELGYQLFIITDKYNQADKISNLQILIDQNVDGIIFGSSQLDKMTISFLNSIDIPVLILGQKSSIFPYCKIDDFNGGKVLGEYVRQIVNRNVVYLAMPLYDLAAGKERLDGFLEGYKNNKEVKVIECGYTPESVYNKKQEILRSKPQILICASDYLALGVLHFMHENDIKYPTDIKLAGMGNYDFSSNFALDITSVDFDYEQLGKNVAKSIVNLISSKNDKAIVGGFNLHLFKRTSTKA